MFQKTVLNSPVEHWLSEKKKPSATQNHFQQKQFQKTLNQDSKSSIK